MLNELTLKYKRIFRILLLLFTAMFLFRLLYGYLYKDNTPAELGGDDFFSSIVKYRRNYASEKTKSFAKSGAEPVAITSGQKYEKVANVRSRSTNFTEEEKLVHGTIRQFGAIVQYQQESGNKGSREIQLLIGVSPEKFDSFYYAVQKIGVIRSTEIKKVDKTNEYRKLNASRVSLEKNLESLNKLTSQPGEIDERIQLHEKIYEVEKQLQDLGVELGNFDTENEFCTVQFSMYEGAVAKTVSLYTRVKVALQWTIKYYLMLMGGLFFASVGAWLLVVIVKKLDLDKSKSA
ncbi:DUF4349 domain-containing protein [Chitinophaga flava]|uniref:DUF4349 domain-containing protein n=1 Tax=Chitinophaga flava TaxID=2259036 RepID=A0A365Y334_9BACT|nr:DUF4349 domain-containing protein [Chitinophaga flava]RBL92728.1 hypothetical protein DF182_09160 [Chitinophaga flava]